ncbi:MAG: tetratricopeptide repeat protein, partial [Bacteroidales bacterium]|nr:tetratricopeptide repeat protein [Bacteroidales bacterium]
AKKNEPNNASLYYVEGNIRSQLGDAEKAIAAYKECSTIDPNYEYGYIGEGILYYNQAIDLQDKAQAELDDAKYMALVQEFEVVLKKCIEPFEKAFEVSKDDSVKSTIAEYLKNTYFRFRDQDDSYQKGYEKYNEYISK